MFLGPPEQCGPVYAKLDGKGAEQGKARGDELDLFFGGAVLEGCYDRGLEVGFNVEELDQLFGSTLPGIWFVFRLA